MKTKRNKQDFKDAEEILEQVYQQLLEYRIAPDKTMFLEAGKFIVSMWLYRLRLAVLNKFKKEIKDLFVEDA